MGGNSIDPIELYDSPYRLSRGQGHPSNSGLGPNGSPMHPAPVLVVPRPCGGVQMLPPTSNGHHVGGTCAAPHTCKHRLAFF